LTRAEENYIKTIFHLGRDTPHLISTNAIARKMETKPSSVTDMAKRLAAKGLLDHERYKGVSLTRTGRRAALNIVRRHRLWEVFLLEKLHFGWDEVHEVAEQLEHINSPKLVEHLDLFLGHPSYDPHGNPIPDAEGRLPKASRKRLSLLGQGDNGVCLGFNDSSPSFLRYLAKKKIGLGTRFEILDIEKFDASMTLLIQSSRVQLTKNATDNIYVDTLDKAAVPKAIGKSNSNR
jgi:DtxR family Mn-dependent transcriptional regulator